MIIKQINCRPNKNKYIQQMDHLGQISLENTVTVKIDYNLNQDLLVKNFSIIMNCLKDLKSQQDKHTNELGNLAGLREMLEKFKQELRVKEEKDGKSTNIQKTAIQNLQKQIDSLKNRMTKNQGQTSNNKNDINNLLKDMNNAKQEIQNIKNQLRQINIGRVSSQEGDKNNQNINQDLLMDLTKQSQQQSAMLLKFMKQLKDMKQHMKKLESDLQNLKNKDDKGQTGEALVSDLIKKIQFLTKKSEDLQNQLQKSNKSIDELNGITEENVKSIDGLEKEVEAIHSQLERLSKLKGNSTTNISTTRNTDTSHLLNDIQKLKQQYDKLLKLINNLKTDKNENTNSNETDRMSNSGKNINKLSQDRSFRKRSQSFDITGKIRELTDRIKALEKMLTGNGDDNPEKLPSIGLKRPNQTAYNPQRSHKKQMAEIKNDLEIWIKSYIDNNMPRNNAANLADLELKIQEIRTNLAKKADHEGMKKGLAFLEGKITQLYLFLTEPESEDAMIVRKGFNCLSCSKKVQSLRGKLGPRMNWDNLNATHHNSMHTPPKVGFPKYNDSNERDSL